MTSFIATSTRAVLAALSLLPTLAHPQQLVISTGIAGNTYDVMARQLAAACKNELERPLVSKPSSGSMENVERLLNNEVPAAIVQTDVLKYRSRQGELDHIKALFTLHPEEVHVLALSETRTLGGVPGLRALPGVSNFAAIAGIPFITLADLRGRKVGAWGGSFITAQVIRLQTEIAFNVVEYADETAALDALTAKSVDALISVGGSPQPWVQRLDRRFRLVPIADAEATKLGSLYRTGRLSYGNLGQTGVQTVSTDAVLVVRDYKTPGMSALLAQTRMCMRLHLAELQETPGNHASWQNVNLDTAPKWPLYVVPLAATGTVSRPTSRGAHSSHAN